jgi:phenylacetate-CoA ligase
MTGLCSEAQPFIRYRTGDMVRMSPEPDKDGRGLHVIAEVMGRQTDFLVRSDGTIMHALAGIYVLRAVDGVGEFKLLQHDKLNLEVQVVANRRWQADMIQAIETGLKKRLGQDVHIQVRLLDTIPPEASGKHRYVVSHVPASTVALSMPLHTPKQKIPDQWTSPNSSACPSAINPGARAICA